MLGTSGKSPGKRTPPPPRTPEESRLLVLASGRRRHKYGTSRPEERTVDGVLFASKLEARRYRELLLLQEYGQLRPPFFLRQVPFHLPGRTRYVLDFLVFWADGRVSLEDAKGHATEVYKLKRRQVEELYQVELTEVRR